MTSKKDLINRKKILEYLDNFYQIQYPDVIKDIMLPILDGKSKISLRFIEYFVTKYCREHVIYIKKKTKTGNTRYITVYDAYHSQLDSWYKHGFDPFKRCDSSSQSKSKSRSRSKSKRLSRITYKDFVNIDVDDLLKYVKKKTACSDDMLNLFTLFVKPQVIDEEQSDDENDIKESQEKFYYKYSDGFIYTSIRQLNFFKWLIEENILSYIDTYYDEIKKDMK